MNVTRLRASLKAVIVIALLTVLNLISPLFSLFVLVVWPVPIVYLAYKYGMKQAVFTIILAAVINGFMFSPMMGLITVIGFGFIGFVIGGSLQEGFKPIKTLIFAILAVIVFQVLTTYVMDTILGFDLRSTFNQVLQNFNIEDYQELKEQLEVQLQFIQSIYPAIIFSSSLITGSLTYFISLWYLNRKGADLEVFPSVRYWHFPRWIISIGLVVALLYRTEIVFLNLLFILLFLTLIQGFAVGLYFVSRGKHAALKWAYIFIIWFFPITPVILILTGLIDLWFNLRRLPARAG